MNDWIIQKSEWIVYMQSNVSLDVAVNSRRPSKGFSVHIAIQTRERNLIKLVSYLQMHQNDASWRERD